MLGLGNIRPSSSSWGSPLHMVQKQIPAAGDAAVVIKPQTTTNTPLERYILPHIQDLYENLDGANIFRNIVIVKLTTEYL